MAHEWVEGSTQMAMIDVERRGPLGWLLGRIAAFMVALAALQRSGSPA